MDRSDADHAACAALIEDAKEPVIVPAPVAVELDWLAARRLGPDPFLAFLDDIRAGALQIADLRADDHARARALMDRYRDLVLGFVDAAVMALVERYGENKLATLDHRHFSVVRPRHRPALRLLP